MGIFRQSSLNWLILVYILFKMKIILYIRCYCPKMNGSDRIRILIAGCWSIHFNSQMTELFIFLVCSSISWKTGYKNCSYLNKKSLGKRNRCKLYFSFLFLLTSFFCLRTDTRWSDPWDVLRMCTTSWTSVGVIRYTWSLQGARLSMLAFWQWYAHFCVLTDTFIVTIIIFFLKLFKWLESIRYHSWYFYWDGFYTF